MSKEKCATVHLKFSHEERNRILATLRGDGDTMQSFFTEVGKLIMVNRDLLEYINKERVVFRATPDVPAMPPDEQTTLVSAP